MIDTDGLGFRLAVAMRRTGLAFAGFRAAIDQADRIRRAEQLAERDRFNRLVDEHARAAR